MRDPKPPAPPRYTEPVFDGHFCPDYVLEPQFLHETVEITLEGEVVRGHLRVAHALVVARLADSPTAIDQEMARWITENQARDDAANDWRRHWWADLATHPAIAAALELGPAELYRRAGLSPAEELAMRLSLVLDDEGQPKSTRAVALEVGMAESTVRARLERAKAALHQLVAAPA